MSEPNETPRGISRLATALAKAQGEFPPIPKDSEVEVKNKEGNRVLYKYKYADLTTIINAVRPALTKHAISFTQGMIAGGFVTTFLHESGEQLQSGFIPCEVPRGDMKQVAGVITYVKRISLTAALGVSADEDVDAAANEAMQGNSTAKGPARKEPPPAKEKENPPSKPAAKNSAPADQATMDRLLDLMIDRGVHENSVNNLITKGYGFRTDRVPVWVADEIGQLLEKEDTNDSTIERKFKEVLKRRQAAQKGGA